VNAPNADIYPIEVSFQALPDEAERDFLNQLPTSFVLPTEAVDRLRRAAATIIFNSPDLQDALKGEIVRIGDSPTTAPSGGPSAPPSPGTPPAMK